MPVTAIVFVHHDGTSDREASSEPPWSEWRLRRAHDHQGQCAYQRASPAYAIRFCSDDEQNGAIVYVQRPIALYRVERASRARSAEWSAREFAEMPDPEEPAP